MIRNVLSIVALVISGFFLYGSNLIAFINQPVWPVKTVIFAVFVTPALVFLLVGFFCRGFNNVRRDLGIVLLSAAGTAAFVVISFVCMWKSPDLAKQLPPNFFQLFGDFFSGVLCFSLYVALGLALLLTSRKRT